MKLSIVLPVYNEAENIGELHTEITDTLKGAGFDYEIIAVNDGSTDGSENALDILAKNNSNFRVLCLSKNYGQTAALSAGFDHARGNIIIPMDADLQNDPADIPALLAKLEEGHDVVSGWRKNRKDNIMRRLPSAIANALISHVTSIKLHDYGCTMKAYRREVVRGVRFYGEMHRFMPVYVAWHGARISEIVVHHRPRIHGKSNYGISRTFRVVLDLLTAKFLVTYLARPMHFFGSAGLISLFFSFLSGIGAIVFKLQGVQFDQTPLPLLTVFLIMMGFQFLLMGILAEIMVRIYHEPRGKNTYAIQRTINFKENEG